MSLHGHQCLLADAPTLTHLLSTRVGTTGTSDKCRRSRKCLKTRAFLTCQAKTQARSWWAQQSSFRVKRNASLSSALCDRHGNTSTLMQGTSRARSVLSAAQHTCTTLNQLFKLHLVSLTFRSSFTVSHCMRVTDILPSSSLRCRRRRHRHHCYCPPRALGSHYRDCHQRF